MAPVDANVRVAVLDGDTADITYPDGTVERARVPGLNTLEGGEKGADWATNYAKQLFAAGYGRAQARDAAHMASGGLRARRRLLYPVSPMGPFPSLAVAQCAKGFAFPFPNADEPDDNKPCFAVAREAAAAGLGIWNPQAFGVGPAANFSLEVMVDPAGSDVEGEYVDIINLEATTVSLAGWRVRSFGPDGPLPKQRGYGFPADARVHAGSRVRLYTHKGVDVPCEIYYWGTDGHKFTNPDPVLGTGDGVVLCDPLDNIRFFQMWGG